MKQGIEALYRQALQADTTQGRMCRDALHTAGQYGHSSMGGMHRLTEAVSALAQAYTDTDTAKGIQAAACGVAYELALLAQGGGWLLAADALDGFHERGVCVTALPIPEPLDRLVCCRFRKVPTGAKVQRAVFELLYVAAKPSLGRSVYTSALETVLLYGIITAAAWEAAPKKEEQVDGNDGATEKCGTRRAE